MRSRLADYQLLGAVAPLDDSWLALAPPRLGLDTQVVVTELGPSAGDWPEVEERLGALAAIRSRYLPELIEVGRYDEDGRPVTWCARADGRPLPAPVGPTEPVAAYRVVAAVARGLHDLHEGGFAHGDLRVRSVLHRDGETLVEPPVRVSPAALAAGGSPDDLDTVEPAALWGEGPSRAGDIWAIGALAHRLLSGTGVHPSLATDQIVTAVQRVLIEPPTISPSLPPGAGDVVRACLAADPGDRPATAAEVADRFEQVAGAR